MTPGPNAEKHKTEYTLVIDVDVCVFIVCVLVAYIVGACNG